MTGKVRLFCFHSAGASQGMFAGLKGIAQDTVELICIDLPGHGTRIRQPALSVVAHIVDWLVGELDSRLDAPFAFLGHSMGALVAYELACELHRRSLPIPCALFVAGYRAPQLPNRDPNLGKLSDEELVERLKNFGGTPPEVLEHPELLALVLPTLRSDLLALDSYQSPRREPLSCRIFAYGGTGDHMANRAEIDAWRDVTTGPFSMQLFPGGHFFITTALPLFKGVLERAIRSL